MMRSLVMVMLGAVLAGGCGAPSAKEDDSQLVVACKFPKEGVQFVGDTGYIGVMAPVDFRCDVAYSTDGTTWVPIEEKGQPQQSQIKETGRIVFVRKLVWRIPDLMTDSLAFRVIARLHSGRMVEKIVPVDTVIDPFTPQSMCSFNPFAL